jgi:hypothetical protein
MSSSEEFVVNFRDLDCNLDEAAALSRRIVCPDCKLRRCPLPCHRSQLSGQEPRSSRPGLRLRAGAFVQRLAATTCRFRGAATPLVQASRL